MLDSPIAARIVRPGHELVDIYGMGIPAVVDDAEREYRAVREGVGLLDFSPLFKVDVEGPGALHELNRLVTRDLVRLAPGRIAYTPIVGADGLMRDDSTVMARAGDRLRVVGGPAMPEQVIPFAQAAGLTAVELRPELAHLNLQGPLSRRLLAAVTDEDVTNDVFPYYTFRESMRVAGVDGVFVTRMGFTAELGYELFVPASRALEAYDALMEAGGPIGVRPVGVAAVMMVRVEAGMVMGDGLEYDESISPWECGLGWAVDLDKGDFQGRAALVELHDQRPGRLASVVLDDGGESATAATLTARGGPVGRVTMAVASPQLGGRTLGLARIHRDFAGPGTRLVASVEGRDVVGEVVSTPVYDPERRRVRS